MTLGYHARKFRNVFGQEIQDNISHTGFVKQKLWDMQIRLISEEFKEFIDASEDCFKDPESDPKRVELVKELSDLVFVCYQFAAAFSIDLDEAMFRVFESNMSKLDNDGNPIYREDGKVLKGPNYKAPDLSVCVPKSTKKSNDN